MKFLAAIICITVGVFGEQIPWDSLHEKFDFDDYLQAYPKPYAKGSEEYNKRKGIFVERLQQIVSHNRDDSHSWKRGLNDFSDLSQEEFVQRYSKVNQQPVYAEEEEAIEHEQDERSLESYFDGLPKKIDWQKHGITTSIHSQCGGSCWAHTTAELLESYVAKEYDLKKDEIPHLSVQEVMACTENPKHCGGTGGCKGATTELGLKWVKKNGLSLMDEFPLSKNHFAPQFCPCVNKCANHLAKKKRMKVMIEGYTTLKKNKLEPLLKAVAKGPVAISVGCDGWQDYSGGVLACKSNPNTVIGHAVVLVGYGKDEKTGHRFWKVRNSWGAGWGEDGYVRLLMRENEHNFCGTNRKPHEGTGCDGGPKTVPVCGTCGILFDSAVPHGVHLVDEDGHRISKDRLHKHLKKLRRRKTFLEADQAIDEIAQSTPSLVEEDSQAHPTLVEQDEEPKSAEEQSEDTSFMEMEDEDETPYSNEDYNVDEALVQHAAENTADEEEDFDAFAEQEAATVEHVNEDVLLTPDDTFPEQEEQ